MRPRTTWLDEAEKDVILGEALGLLERVGMRFGECRALVTLAEAGADVDRTAGVAHIPREMVTEALSTCPRSFLLAGATPSQDLVLDGTTHFSTSGTPTKVLDRTTGECRASTSEDLRQATLVADACSAVDMLWPLVSAEGRSDDHVHLMGLATMLRFTRKHFSYDVEHRGQVQPMLRLLEAAGHTRDTLRTRPRISLTACTASPLRVHGAMLDATLELGALGIPVIIYPMPIAGATAPVTLSGTLTVSLAEFLGAAVAAQLTAPGMPLIMGAGASTLDMRTTACALGSIESALMRAALSELAHHIGTPALCAGLATDSNHSGIQAGFEKALVGLAVASAGADIITGGIGLLGGAGIMSLPQIVIDAEISVMIRRLLTATDTSPKSILAASVERVGFDGHFLAEKETRLRVRGGDFLTPTIASREPHETWRAHGHDELWRANRLVDEILSRARSGESAPILSSEQDNAIDEILDSVTPIGFAMPCHDPATVHHRENNR